MKEGLYTKDEKEYKSDEVEVVKFWKQELRMLFEYKVEILMAD